MKHPNEKTSLERLSSACGYDPNDPFRDEPFKYKPRKKQTNGEGTMTDPNDAAYPMPTDAYHSHGLTKRELLAAMAMSSLGREIANATATDFIARKSVAMADALIEALNTPTETT